MDNQIPQELLTMNYMKRFYHSLFPVTIMLALGACATNPVTGQKDLVFMSEGQEVALGNQASKQIM